MKIENCKLKIAKHDAFTLIEILVAIAIVGILAAVVLVSMNSFGAKARSSKAMAQLSSAIPSMVSCWGNGLTPNAPSSGGNICGSNSNYGTWPIAGSGDLTNYAYTGSVLTNKSTWYIRLRNDTDKKGICCNSRMNNCSIQDKGGTWPSCTASSPTN